MTDQRFCRLASQVIGYSVSLQKGEKILIDVWDGADDLGEALMNAAYAAGASPVPRREYSAARTWGWRYTGP